MVLIFGWSPRHHRIETVDELLHCPDCDRSTPFDRYDVRSWFRLFFVPVLPIGARRHVIECSRCGYSVEMPADRVKMRSLQSDR